jgi:pyridoxamine 5'-phosphate oxidase
MLRDIRKQYLFSSLDEQNMQNNPILQFEMWLHDAIEGEQLEPTAMIISTVDEDFKSHSRVVLLKELSSQGFVFYSNYESHKAQQIDQNNHVSLVFFWPTLERQVRVEGIIEKLNDTISTTYFKTRPIDSQLGAWASPQSKVIASHDFLEQQFLFYQQKFDIDVPKPKHWGGYLIKPTSIEFWQGRANRLHDRLLYTFDNDVWKLCRLAP